jgi:hypothetical protein
VILVCWPPGVVEEPTVIRKGKTRKRGKPKEGSTSLTTDASSPSQPRALSASLLPNDSIPINNNSRDSTLRNNSQPNDSRSSLGPTALDNTPRNPTDTHTRDSLSSNQAPQRDNTPLPSSSAPIQHESNNDGPQPATGPNKRRRKDNDISTKRMNGRRYQHPSGQSQTQQSRRGGPGTLRRGQGVQVRMYQEYVPRQS